MIKKLTPSLSNARWLIATIIVALMFSPAITNLAELLLVLTIILSPELRQRVYNSSNQPIVLGALTFYFIISIGVLYSAANYMDAISMWTGWRKILLLPLAVALFDDEGSKFNLSLVFISAACFFCLMSFIGIITHTYFPVPEHALGITVRNHATQGMIFSVAAFTSATIALNIKRLSAKFRLIMALSSLLLIINIAFISNGRSGYVALIICSIALVLGQLIYSNRITIKSISLGALSIGVIVATLAIAPDSKQRISQAFDEATHYQEKTEITSMGIRMYFWKNTWELIKEKPLLGYGTGAFESAYREHISNQSGVAATITSDPHNQFLKIATEHGLFGLLVFFAFLASNLRQKSCAPYRMLGLGVLFAWMATSLANSHFSTFSEGIFIFTWIGVMLANESKQNSHAEKN
jgi:O-antigen ligase